jgi:hypothetical protein
LYDRISFFKNSKISQNTTISLLHVLHSHGDSYDVAFTCPSQQKMTSSKSLGTPKNWDIDGKPLDKAMPKYLVRAAEWDDWADEIEVIGLGESFLQGTEPASRHLLRVLKAPEIIFEGSFDHRADL